jgi:hypothetical protein
LERWLEWINFRARPLCALPPVVLRLPIIERIECECMCCV